MDEVSEGIQALKRRKTWTGWNSSGPVERRWRKFDKRIPLTNLQNMGKWRNAERIKGLCLFIKTKFVAMRFNSTLHCMQDNYPLSLSKDAEEIVGDYLSGFRKEVPLLTICYLLDNWWEKYESVRELSIIYLWTFRKSKKIADNVEV